MPARIVRPGADDVLDDHDGAVVDRGRHLGLAQPRPRAAAREVVAIEGRIEDAQGHGLAGQGREMLDQDAAEGHPAVRNGDEVELVHPFGALDDLVGDAQQGAPDRRIVENGPLRRCRRGRIGLSWRACVRRAATRFASTLLRLTGRT